MHNPQNSPSAWPINASLITLRVCEDLGWRVMVSCPSCRYSVAINTRIMASSRYAAEPIQKLLERGAFKCRRKKAGAGCDGVKATALDVSCMDVGMSKTVAAWEVTWPNGPDSPGSATRKLQP